MHVCVCYLCLQMMVCTWRMLLTETSTSCVRVEGYGLEHVKPFTFGLGSLSRWAIQQITVWYKILVAGHKIWQICHKRH